MPEMTVIVRWPDGSVEQHYSPSLVMHDHLRVGATYTVADFAERARTALDEAAERVRAKYGFYCTSAAGSAGRISELAAAYPPQATVEVLAMEPPLPEGTQSAAPVPYVTVPSSAPASPQEPR
jgi:uncharacterized repeat protein (TIGR04042 family)